MSIDQQATPKQRETAVGFIAMLTTLRDEFDREAASMREEASGRPLTLAAAWLAEQEKRLWQRIFGAATRRREVMRIMLAFWALPRDVRISYMGRLRQCDRLLHAFADALLRRACVERDAMEYQRALTAFVVCDEGRNWRESLASLCLYWHAARRLGLDAAAVFEAMAASATPGAADMLHDFAARSPADRRLDIFGLTEADLDRLFQVDALA